jgi:phosphomannomutase
MRETGAVAGGEGSGGVIHPGLHYMRDAMAGIGLVLSHLAGSGGSLSELKHSLPGYVIRKSAVSVSGKDTGTLLDSLVASMASSARINRDDGVKFDFDEGWVHLRRSNTEPIVRIIAEGGTAADADRLLERFRKALD